uniref:Neur_chan_LBD domain-containing protein n=1 Tax=Steinernema glaseri TaxID=37863 RepID=A0A1I7Z530_9BILA
MGNTLSVIEVCTWIHTYKAFAQAFHHQNILPSPVHNLKFCICCTHLVMSHYLPYPSSAIYVLSASPLPTHKECFRIDYKFHSKEVVMGTYAMCIWRSSDAVNSLISFPEDRWLYQVHIALSRSIWFPSQPPLPPEGRAPYEPPTTTALQTLTLCK